MKFPCNLKALLDCGLLLLCSACFVSVSPQVSTQTPATLATETPTIIWFPSTAFYTPFPTAAINPTADLRPGIGDLLLEDDLSDASVWSLSSANDASSSVANGRINLSLKSSKTSLITTRSGPVFTDFYAEITASPNFCHGEDEYGLIIRDLEGDHYRFALSCDGRVKVDRYYGDSLSRQVGWLQSGAIPSVSPSTSLLQVWAAGSQLRFFVNDLYLFSVTDSLLYKGTIGVFVYTSGEGDVSVSFSNLKVWVVKK